MLVQRVNIKLQYQKTVTIPAVNLLPFHAKKARRLYAILTRGESRVMEMKYYNDLKEESSEEYI